jgi:hypothetical protein
MSSLPAFVTVEELAARMPGGLADADRARAQAALDDASTLIRLEAGTAWAADGTIDFGDLDDWKQDVVTAVAIAAARRALENPDGATEMSIGDASMKLANDSNDVFLKAAEKSAIRSIAGRGGTFGSIDLEIGTPGYSGYIDVAGQDEPLPFTYEPLRP